MEDNYWRAFGRSAADLYASALAPAVVVFGAAGAMTAPRGQRMMGSVLKVKTHLPAFALFWTVPSIFGGYYIVRVQRLLKEERLRLLEEIRKRKYLSGSAPGASN